MATTPSFVQVTEGAGKRLSAATYTENAQVVYDQKFIPGEIYLPTYTAVAPGVSASTVNSHMIEIMAGASLNVRIRRIVMTQNAGAATLIVMPLQIWRLTTAGTGGTVVATVRYDTSDANSGATAMSLATAKGTEAGNPLWLETLWAGTGVTGAASLRWQQSPNGKPIIIPAGAANGFAIKNTAAVATATWDITVEFVETSW